MGRGACFSSGVKKRGLALALAATMSIAVAQDHERLEAPIPTISEPGQAQAYVYGDWTAHTARSAMLAGWCGLKDPRWSVRVQSALASAWVLKRSEFLAVSDNKDAFAAYWDRVNTWLTNGAITARPEEASPAVCARLRTSDEVAIASRAYLNLLAQGIE